MNEYKHKTAHGLLFSKMDGNSDIDDGDGRASNTTHVRRNQELAGIGSTTRKPKKSKK